MSDKKISQLPEATYPLSDTDSVAIVQGTTTYQASIVEIRGDGGGKQFLQQKFTYVSGVQEFTPTNGISTILALFVNGQQWDKPTQWTNDATKITVLDTLTSGSIVSIIYTDGSVGVLPTFTQAQIEALLLEKEDIANKGINNGYAPLDSGGKIPLANLPSTLLKYVGTWNASTNTPTLTNPDLTKVGNVYNVSVAGTQFGINFKLGDWLIYNSLGVPEKSDNSDDVVSVNGQTGVVVLDADNISETATRKWVSPTEKTTWNAKFNTPTGLTTNFLPKWNGNLTNSLVSDDGSTINVNGVLRSIGFILANAGIQANVSTGRPFIFGSTLVNNNYGVFKQNNGTDLAYIGDANGSATGGGTAADFAIAVPSGNLFLNSVGGIITNGTISASPATTANQVVVKSQLDAVGKRQKEVKFFQGGAITQNSVIGNNFQEFLYQGYNLKKITVVFGEQSMNVNKTIPITISLIDTDSLAPTSALAYTANCNMVVGLVYNKVYTFDINVALTSAKLLTVGTGAFTASTQTLNDCMITLVLEEI